MAVAAVSPQGAVFPRGSAQKVSIFAAFLGGAGWLSLSLFLAGCASRPPSDFAAGEPKFDPVAYFTGHTISSGVLETRRGDPQERVTTETTGRRKGDLLLLEQDLRFADRPKQHRSWRIRKLDEHRYEATANDMVGVARGEAYGNVFHWSFTLALSPGNPLANVQMSQWMYLQSDRRTMVNHTTIRKLGFVAAQVTEQFRRTEN
ncbi:MAG: DUF3833 family protein [Chthoniobacterales bacterium]